MRRSLALLAVLAGLLILAPAAGAAPANTYLPTITGILTEGQQLAASNGVWVNTSDPPSTFSYQWERCSGSCIAIPWATQSGYVPIRADVGSTLEVQVTATDAAGLTTTATSSPYGPVASNGQTAYYVDGASTGGACSNAYTTTQAQSTSTPWCSLQTAVNDLNTASSAAEIVVRHCATCAGNGGGLDGYSGTIYNTATTEIGQIDLTNDQPTATVTLEPYGTASTADSVLVSGFWMSGTSNFTIDGFNIADPALPNGCPFATAHDMGAANLPSADYCFPGESNNSPSSGPTLTLNNQLYNGTSNMTFNDDNFSTSIHNVTGGPTCTGNPCPLNNDTWYGDRFHNLGWHGVMYTGMTTSGTITGGSPITSVPINATTPTTIPASQTTTFPAGSFITLLSASVGTLSTPLSTSSTYTALPVNALAGSIATNTDLLIQSGTNNQDWVTTAPVSPGATSIPVKAAPGYVGAQAPNFAYPANTTTISFFDQTTSANWSSGNTVAGATTINLTGSFTPANTYPPGSSVFAGQYQTNGVIPFNANSGTLTNWTISHSEIDHIHSIGMLLGSITGVTVDHDTFAYEEVPNGVMIHTDGIASSGGINNLTYTNNLSYQSGIPINTLCNTPVKQCGSSWTIANNVMIGCGAYCVGMSNQNGGTNYIYNNVMWKSGATGTNASLSLSWFDTCCTTAWDGTSGYGTFYVENNLLTKFGDGSSGSLGSVKGNLLAGEDYNAIMYSTQPPYGAHDLIAPAQWPSFATAIGTNCGGDTFDDTDTNDPGCGGIGSDGNANAALLAASTGVGAGTNGGLIPGTDILGNNRTVPYDMGAFQFNVDSQAGVVVPPNGPPLPLPPFMALAAGALVLGGGVLVARRKGWL